MPYITPRSHPPRRTATSLRADDRGAAAVEFALILPVLLLLVLGLVEFSRLYNVQISLSNAAREGARSMAIHNLTSQARTDAIGAAPSVALSSGNVAISPSNCASGGTVHVTVSYDAPLMTGMFGSRIGLTGTGVMRCGG